MLVVIIGFMFQYKDCRALALKTVTCTDDLQGVPQAHMHDVMTLHCMLNHHLVNIQKICHCKSGTVLQFSRLTSHDYRVTREWSTFVVQPGIADFVPLVSPKTIRAEHVFFFFLSFQGSKNWPPSVRLQRKNPV